MIGTDQDTIARPGGASNALSCARDGCEERFRIARPHQRYCSDRCRMLAFEARQARLDFEPPVGRQFHGEGYEPAKDQKRWEGHCAAVLAVLRGTAGTWWTYEALGRAAGVPVGSVRTRVSNLHADGVPIETRTRPDRFREVRLSE